MGTALRLKKPEPERTGPIRQWRSGAPEETPEDGAPEAVGMGYRVIDEYLKQGRRTAEGLGLGGGFAGGLAAAGSFQQVSARLFGDALVWLEHLARLTTASSPEGTPRPRGEGAETASGFGVRVASTRPVEVDLQLQPGAGGRELGVHDLRMAGRDAPPIPIELVHAERWRVDLRVPDAQPEGLYTAIVYDRRDGSICGTAAVRVGTAR